jgi:hypothetical protein
MIVGEQIGEIASNAETLIRLIVKIDLGLPSIEPELARRLAR